MGEVQVMGIILLIISLVIAGGGVFLIADFALWFTSGRIATARIDDMSKRTSKGMNLPVVVFETADGREVKATAQRIDQFLFLLNRPQPGYYTQVIYKESDPHSVRVHGYIHVVCGLILFLPFLTVVALNARNWAAFEQIAYAGVFAGLSIGGWVLLKFIQRG
jgi:hypothetical protein